MDEAAARQVLKRFVKQYPTQKDAAAALDIGPAYMSDLLAGRRMFSRRILDALGLEREVIIVIKRKLIA